MISPINTAVRWYTDIFESDRFSSDCDIERFELISDKTRLLPFQFRRPKNPYPISRWFLRKHCVNTVEPLLEANDSLFTYNTGFWTKLKFGFLNGKIRTTGGASPSNLRKFGIFTIGKYYDITIVVNEFIKVPLSSFAVTHDIAGNGVVAITGTGTIKIKILATTADFSIDVVGGTSADSITIESVKINEYQVFDTGIGDIDLDSTLLSLINLSTTSDLIQYCGDSLPIQIPCGKYYMLITYGESDIVYSELITVKDFIPSQSPFTMIEWTNGCDLSDIIYQPINGCQYKNRLYIHSELSKMEYPFKEEGEEDGNYKLNITFQKWEKTSNLIFPKCPEFIVDALTAIRLHDTVTVTKSLRKNQYEVLEAIEIEKVEYENTSVFTDCATNVDLKLLMKDKVVDSTCCANITIPTCVECGYTVDEVDLLTGEYYFGVYGEDFGLFRVVEGVYTNISADGQVVCVTDSGLKYLSYNGEYWTVVPRINSVIDTDLGSGNHSYAISGYSYAGTFVRLIVTIYDAVTGITTTDTITTIYTSAQLYSGITILSSLFSVDVPENGAVEFSFENFTITCDYGTSNSSVIEYLSLHPKVQDWSDLLSEQPSTETLWYINNFIQGLDDDGILEEFDLLHVLAGLETDEQRLTPLISTSGNAFTTSLTQDSSGIQGDGSLYVNLSWQSTVDSVKMVNGDCSFGFYSNTDVNNPGYDMGYLDTSISLYAHIKSRHFNTFVAAANSNTDVSTALTNSIGLFHVEGIGTTINSYKNGTLLASGSVVSTALNSYNWHLANVYHTSGSYPGSTRLFQFVFIGSSSVDKTILYNRFNALKTALGF